MAPLRQLRLPCIGRPTTPDPQSPPAHTGQRKARAGSTQQHRQQPGTKHHGASRTAAHDASKANPPRKQTAQSTEQTSKAGTTRPTQQSSRATQVWEQLICNPETTNKTEAAWGHADGAWHPEHTEHWKTQAPGGHAPWAHH